MQPSQLILSSPRFHPLIWKIFKTSPSQCSETTTKITMLDRYVSRACRASLAESHYNVEHGRDIV